MTADARHKRCRHEYGAQHQGDGDYRTGDFVHRLAAGVARRHPFGQPALHVLHDDDGIVNDDTDRQHEPKQREVVQRKTQQGHDGKRADQRNGNRNHRDNGGPPVLQENQDDNEDKNECLDQRMNHTRDRFLNKHRGIIVNSIFNTFGKLGLELVHFGSDGFGRIECVGTRQLEDGQSR